LNGRSRKSLPIVKALHGQVARMEDYGTAYLESISKMSETIHALLDAEHAQERTFKWEFVAALLLAVAPLLFFLFPGV
jgi:hypothetical protein